MPPSKPAYDVDWVFSNNSNVHVANHRDWYVSYTPFATTFGDFCTNGPGAPVLGVGVVASPTKTHPTRAGAAYQGTIILRDVLYAPSVCCNILGGPILDDNGVKLGGRPSKITTKTGVCIGLLDRNHLYRLRLQGQSAKQTSLEAGTPYAIYANWPSSERASWEAFQANRSSKGHTRSNTEDSAGSQLADVEKKWLKDHYGGEFKFLRAYSLSIYKDEDREEGRRMLRAMMTEESERSESESDKDSLNSFERDLEDNPSSHAADYHFSAPELGWIKTHFGHNDIWIEIL
ncbi:MAG: hypothetical protein Q9170_002988 [Blastenia crenularia]